MEERKTEMRRIECTLFGVKERRWRLMGGLDA